MLPRFNLARLLWIMLLICFLSISGSNSAQADEALASWYGPGLQGKPTANGDTYSTSGYTAAHRTLPIGTELIVGYKGRSIPVTVNDRGPFSGDRELDLSQAAARELGMITPGVDYVQVSCADGGDYPNCYPSPEAETRIQGHTTLQDNIAVQDGTAFQGDTPAPTIQQDTAFPGGSSLQDGTTVQGTPTFQSSPTLQGDGAVQGEFGAVHVIQPGETLSGIAAALGTSVEYLATHNGIANPDLIYSGQALLY